MKFRIIAHLAALAFAITGAAAAQATPFVLFADDFNRPDGPVGNGWTDSAPSDGSLGILNGKLSATSEITPGQGTAGIIRALTFSGPLHIQATITEMDAAPGIGSRFESQFTTRSNGNQNSVVLGPIDFQSAGFGIAVIRTSESHNNSQVHLLNNASEAVQFSTFQFDSVLDVEFTASPDGSLTGSITEGSNVFEFDFGPRTIAWSGTNFHYAHNQFAAGGSLRHTLDDLVITAIPEPTTALLLATGLAALAVRRGRLR